MNKFVLLLKGDQSRMKRYGITYASLATSVLWIIMIQMININAIDKYFPLFIFIDVTMMSFLLIGVAMMFEKQESALKTMLVTPISKHHYLLSKIVSTVIASLITLILLGGYGVVFKNLRINYAGITGAVALSAFAFSCIGILFTYKSKDFTILLMWVMAFFFVLAIPTILQMFGIITADWFKYVQYLNPMQAVLTLLNSAVMDIARKDFLISLSYLIGLTALMYYFAAKYFDIYSMKEFGGE
jgi:fluoroquinolone transport system permease protein